jgi:hypothetical protein
MTTRRGKVLATLFIALFLAACAGGSGSGSTRVHYGMGYGGYYGGGPWRGYSNYPVYVGGGRPDIPHIPEGPTAVQMPSMGMPDVGMMDMDMGGFDF